MELSIKENKFSPLIAKSQQTERQGDFPRWSRLVSQVIKEREERAKHGNIAQEQKNLSESR